MKKLSLTQLAAQKMKRNSLAQVFGAQADSNCVCFWMEGDEDMVDCKKKSEGSVSALDQWICPLCEELFGTKK